MNKKIIVAILLLVVIIIGVVIAVVINKEKGQNDLLTAEINALSPENTNTDVKTTGQYAIVEKLIKEDYKLYIESTNTLRANYEKLAQVKVINLDNFEKDGPEFAESLKLLNGIKEENAALIAKLEEIVDDTKIQEKISDIPRESWNEEKIRDYLVNFAENRRLEYYTDEYFNVIIRKPATPG